MPSGQETVGLFYIPGPTWGQTEDGPFQCMRMCQRGLRAGVCLLTSQSTCLINIHDVCTCAECHTTWSVSVVQ